MAFSNPITGGQGALIRPAIKSPNYVPGVSGWSINRIGSAEFNDLTIRGTFFGTSYIINTAGAFFYTGTPANGNLFLSIAAAAGTDAFANAYFAGFNVGNQQGAHFGVDRTGRVYVDNSGGNQVQFIDSASGSQTIGLATAAHWFFDVVNSQFSMFDLNALLTARLSAQLTNSSLFWLFNNSSQYFALNGGRIDLGGLTTPGQMPTLGDQANSGGLTVSLGANPSLLIASNKNTSGTGSVQPYIEMRTGNPGLGKPGASGNSVINLFNSLFGSAVDVALQGGALYRSDLTGWQPVVPGAGWATSAIRGAAPAMYMIDGQDTLWVRGSMNTTTATPSGTPFTLAPAGTYQPVAAWNLQQDLILKQNSAGAGFTFGHLFVSGANVSVNGLTYASGDIISFNHSFALGNLA